MGRTHRFLADAGLRIFVLQGVIPHQLDLV